MPRRPWGVAQELDVRGANYVLVASPDCGAGWIVMVHCKVYPWRYSGTMLRRIDQTAYQ
jgi:hypothetical protein